MPSLFLLGLSFSQGYFGLDQDIRQAMLYFQQVIDTCRSLQKGDETDLSAFADDEKNAYLLSLHHLATIYLYGRARSLSADGRTRTQMHAESSSSSKAVTDASEAAKDENNEQEMEVAGSGAGNDFDFGTWLKSESKRLRRRLAKERRQKVDSMTSLSANGTSNACWKCAAGTVCAPQRFWALAARASTVS